MTRDDVVRRLRPLVDLPVELVLPAHGERTDRSTLERVLSRTAPARLSAASRDARRGP